MRCRLDSVALLLKYSQGGVAADRGAGPGRARRHHHGTGTAATGPFAFDRTMRVDYFHTGGPGHRRNVALDRVVNDGAWPGSRTQLIDATNLGNDLVEVRAKIDGK